MNYTASIVIPVFNQWRFTERCLVCLSKTISADFCEVIVVDNASTDETPRFCPIFGRTLFHDSFHYIRNETNRNFGPASNQGAEIAKGKYLVFLNNDTEVMGDWLGLLLQDMSTYPKLACTGPLLLFPENKYFGYTVQHLGVYLSPNNLVDHLYQGISERSPLAKKRRFFQAITAACLLIPRKLFFAVGKFDEVYVNGREDIDLCARLRKQNLLCTVNPQARVIHHTSQTENRHVKTLSNDEYFFKKSFFYLAPDWDIFVQNDGLIPEFNAWLMQTIRDPSCCNSPLYPRLSEADCGELCSFLCEYPFCEEGWRALLRRAQECYDPILIDIARRYIFLFYPSPEFEFETFTQRDDKGNILCSEEHFVHLLRYVRPWADFVDVAERQRSHISHSRRIGEIPLYDAWFEKKQMYADRYLRFVRTIWPLARSKPLMPSNDAHYNLWRLMSAERNNDPIPLPHIFFSVVVRADVKDAKNLQRTLDALLAQTWSAWELCLVLPKECVSQLPKALFQDKRIRVFAFSKDTEQKVWRDAVDDSQGPWIVFVDAKGFLEPSALTRMAEAIARSKTGLLFYADEDKVQFTDAFVDPCYKSARFDRYFFWSRDFLSSFVVLRKDRCTDSSSSACLSCDDALYNLLLRYVDSVRDSECVHVPLMLYHRYVAQSPSEYLKARSRGQEDQARVFSSYCASKNARLCLVHEKNTLNLCVAPPSPLPNVSLLLDCVHISGAYTECELRQLLQKLHFYPQLNVICFYQESLKNLVFPVQEEFPDALFVSVREKKPLFSMLSTVLGDITGDVLLFLNAHVHPTSDSWLQDVLAPLFLPGVGAVGGKLRTPDGAFVHCGYMVDAKSRLIPLFPGKKNRNSTWSDWQQLQHSVDALDELCFLTRREFLKNADFCASAKDYCFSLRSQGLSTLWWPYTAFEFTGELVVALEHVNYPPFHPDIALSVNGELCLCVPKV